MDLPDLGPTHGALLIGVYCAIFFQGVLSVQVYIYYESFPDDDWKLKALVAAVWCIDFLHLVLISQNSYYYLVTNWGKEAPLGFSIWEGNMHAAISGLAGLTCQLFYLHRIWVFSSKNRALVLLLTSLCLTTFALDVTISTNLMLNRSVSEFSSLTTEAIVLFAMGAGADAVMALMLCIYVQRARSGLKRTNYIISKIVRYSVATSLATSLLAIGCLVSYFASPKSLIFIAMHFSLGRAYTNSLLANLNSRKSMKSIMASEKSHITASGIDFRTIGPTPSQNGTYLENTTTGDIEHVVLGDSDCERGSDATSKLSDHSK